MKFVWGIFALPDIKIRETKEGMYEVTEVQTKPSFYYRWIIDIFVHSTFFYFVINHWLGNFTIIWK